MIITDEVKEISLELIDGISEAGCVVKLKVVDSTPASGSSEKDKYAQFYGQTKNSNPSIKSSFDIHALLSYSPSADKLKGSGLDEECHIIVTVATYELIKIGYCNMNENIQSVLTDLKRGRLFEIDGKSFSIKEVGADSSYQGFNVICHLGCDLYA